MKMKRLRVKSLVPVIIPKVQDVPENNTVSKLKVGQEITSAPPDCKECPEGLKTVEVDSIAWASIMQIAEQFPNTEFAVYLLGTILQNKAFIGDYYIPEQEVTMAHVTITEDIPPEISSQVIGPFHSHHTMGAFHSHEDQTHFNYPVHMVWSTSGTKVTTRRRTSCNKFMQAPAELKIVNRNAVAPHGIEKIKKVAITYVKNQGWYNNWARFQDKENDTKEDSQDEVIPSKKIAEMSEEDWQQFVRECYPEYNC